MSPLKEMYAAADDVSDWAVKQQQARFAPIGTAIPDPRPPHRWVPAHVLTGAEAIRLSVSDKDIASAVDWMHANDEISQDLCERISDKAVEFCEQRLRSQA